MKIASAILALLTMAATSAFAADVTATWHVEVAVGEQNSSPTFTLKQDGEQLTGTYAGALGELPITGSVKGNEVALDVDVAGLAVHYSGTIDGAGKTIEGTVDYGGQASGTFTATRK